MPCSVSGLEKYHIIHSTFQEFTTENIRTQKLKNEQCLNGFRYNFAELNTLQSAQPVIKLAETSLANTTAMSKRSLCRGLSNPWRVPSELLKPLTSKAEKRKRI